jgi:hypothetical protein
VPEKPTPDPDTIDALVENLRHFLDAENEREQSANTRAGNLVLFGGATLALTAGTLGRRAIAVDLPGVLDGVSVVLYVAAIALLLAAILLTLLKVMLPKESASIGIKEIEQYNTPAYFTAAKAEIQGVTMAGLIRVLAIDRNRASDKIRWLRRSFVVLAAGLVCLALLAILIAFEEAAIL